MSQVHRNACRVCLKEGTKAIFNNSSSAATADLPSALQYDRLAEKLRFVCMLPIRDSQDLPNMLCYSCIVQLNMAYNFKNVVIETNMYLERLAIEKGLVSGVLTPTPSSIRSGGGFHDDGRTSTVSYLNAGSEVRLQAVAYPQPAVSTVSTSNSLQCSSEQEQQMNTISTPSPCTGDDSCMLDARKIKTEPDEDLIESSLLQNLDWAAAEIPSRRQGTTKSPKRASVATPTKKTVSTGRPMVAVYNQISRSSVQDKQYLERFLTSKGNKPNGDGLSKKAKKGFIHHRSALNYDLKNSKIIQEMFKNMPSNRLRTRRTST